MMHWYNQSLVPTQKIWAAQFKRLASYLRYETRYEENTKAVRAGRTIKEYYPNNMCIAHPLSCIHRDISF